jgi:hypothetical protein
MNLVDAICIYLNGWSAEKKLLEEARDLIADRAIELRDKENKKEKKIESIKKELAELKKKLEEM